MLAWKMDVKPKMMMMMMKMIVNHLPDIDEVDDNDGRIDILNNLIANTETEKFLQNYNGKSVDGGESTITGQAIGEANQSQPWDFRNNDEMVENSVKVLNEDDVKSINALSNNIISVANGVPNWIYFAEWLTQQGGLDALSDNFMTILTGEIFLNGQNIISENLYQFISCMVDENR